MKFGKIQTEFNFDGGEDTRLDFFNKKPNQFVGQHEFVKNKTSKINFISLFF